MTAQLQPQNVSLRTNIPVVASSSCWWNQSLSCLYWTLKSAFDLHHGLTNDCICTLRSMAYKSLHWHHLYCRYWNRRQHQCWGQQWKWPTKIICCFHGDCTRLGDLWWKVKWRWAQCFSPKDGASLLHSIMSHLLRYQHFSMDHFRQRHSYEL